jgi:hypothetical protein
MVKLFGSTISETVSALNARIHAGGEQPSSDDKVKAIGRIIISCLMIILATYLFIKGSKDVAGTIVGAITGYWMK